MTISSLFSSAYASIRAFFSFLRRRWKMTLLTLGIGLPVLLILIAVFSPTKVEYVTEPAKHETLIQRVEANGTVTSDRDIELKFPAVSGVVDQVYVKEGAKVKAGQRLATLKASGLGAAVASASAVLQSQQAQLNLMRQGTRPEDIAIAEAELMSKKAALETAKTSLQNAENTVKTSTDQLQALTYQLDTSLAGNVSDAQSAIGQNVSTAQSALQTISTIFVRSDVRDAMFSSMRPSAENDLRAIQDTATTSLTSALRLAPTTVDTAITSLQQARAAVQQSVNALQFAASVLATLPQTNSYSSTQRETDKASIATALTTAQGAMSNIDGTLSAIRNASATYSTQILSEQAKLNTAKNNRDSAKSDILTYESSVRISEAQLQLKRAGSRPEDLAAQEARVRQAQADVARAASSYNDTILTAPIDGTVTKVNIKTGEYTPSTAAVTLLGNSPYRVEMYVSEIDIPSIQLTQSGSIELDAFRGTPMKLHVSEIDPASTDRDGVPKYRIVLDFMYRHDDLKIGMTGDAEIVTGMSPDVITVQARAVLEDEDGRSYVRILKDGKVEERTVTTGLDGSNGEIEVTGVQEGEEVIILEK